MMGKMRCWRWDVFVLKYFDEDADFEAQEKKKKKRYFYLPSNFTPNKYESLRFISVWMYQDLLTDQLNAANSVLFHYRLDLSLWCIKLITLHVVSKWSENFAKEQVQFDVGVEDGILQSFATAEDDVSGGGDGNGVFFFG